MSINVGKTPGKNEFFRTHDKFRPEVPMVDLEVGMDRHYFAVTPDMVVALAGHRHHRHDPHALSDSDARAAP